MNFSFVIFLFKGCLLGQTKRRGTLLTIFRCPRIFQPSPDYYILHIFPNPCFLEPSLPTPTAPDQPFPTSPFTRDLRVVPKELSNFVSDITRTLTFRYRHLLTERIYYFSLSSKIGKIVLLYYSTGRVYILKLYQPI